MSRFANWLLDHAVALIVVLTLIVTVLLVIAVKQAHVDANECKTQYGGRYVGGGKYGDALCIDSDGRIAKVY